ncbi:hypothetical protein [Halomicrobium salinisoli]|uniref:hypothetical protein n=1 Tax=Halomicrobium salinisoli TaxID=2878391 RepID=UPI001CF07382|nr:hypothetical protein [Halomicrobium salinisoli]
MTVDVDQLGDDVPSLEEHRRQLRGIAERAEQAAVVGPVATDGGQAVDDMERFRHRFMNVRKRNIQPIFIGQWPDEKCGEGAGGEP